MDKDRKRGISLNHEERKREVLEINEIGPLLACAVATNSLLCSVPRDDCLRVRDQFLENFNNGSRADKLDSIQRVIDICKDTSNVLNPGSKDSDLALNLRRLTLIQRIVETGIAEDKLAVDAADLVLGNFFLNLENNSLYREWQKK